MALRAHAWARGARAVALAAGLALGATASCTCDPLCDDDLITEVKSTAGSSARLTWRGCGAATTDTRPSISTAS